MDALTFICEITRALAWPISTVIVFLCLRRPIVDVVARVMKLRYNELEVEFSATLKRAEREADAVRLPSGAEVSSLPVGGTEPAAAKYLRLARSSARTAILEASRDLDRALRTAAVGQDFDDIQIDEHPNVDATIRRLQKDRVLDPVSSSLLRELFLLRNQALNALEHEVSFGDGYAFCMLASRLIAKIQGAKGE